MDALFGVPQPPRHHPEIDTGLHVLLCLREAARKAASLPVRYAVLLHDLGKALTPVEELPAHHGHEARSATLAEAVSKRLRAPVAYRELAVLVARHHLTIHRACELKPSTLVDLLETLDAFRRPDRVADILAACEIDARGRTGLEDRPYPSRPHLEQALAVLGKLDLKALVATLPAGRQVREAIRDARIAALSGAAPRGPGVT